MYISTGTIIVDYGINATMTCISNQPSYSYRWTKFIGDSYQNLQTSSKYSVRGRSITIYSVDLNDNGNYRCEELRGDGSVRGTETPIQLVVKGLS